MTAARHPRETVKLLSRMEETLWTIFTVLLALGLVVLGLNYGLGGDKSASSALDSVRHLTSIRTFGVVTLASGILVFATLQTKWVVLTLWVAFAWAAIAATLVAIGAYNAGQGGAGVVLWGIFVAPPAVILTLTAPDKSLLFALIGWVDQHCTRRRERQAENTDRREGRGGAA